MDWKHLLEADRHKDIINNPLKAGLCQHPEVYKYSSARFYELNEKEARQNLGGQIIDLENGGKIVATFSYLKGFGPNHLADAMAKTFVLFILGFILGLQS